MIGFEIHSRQRAVSPELIEKFRKLPVANISDCMSRMVAGGARQTVSLELSKWGGAVKKEEAATAKCILVSEIRFSKRVRQMKVPRSIRRVSVPVRWLSTAMRSR